MKKTIFIFAIFSISVSLLFSSTLEERINNISKAEMQSVVEFLSHDVVEGRAPGTRGGYLSELYMQSLFKFMDLDPGADGKYLQPFKLQGFTAKEMALSANNVELKHIEDFVGTYARDEKEFELEADAVFIGFGIATRHWKWDDYKGVDVKDKFVITRVNDPGLYRPDKFEGKTLTYYGRWTYHIEEAARRGAVGILLIHTDHTAGYGWNVVQNGWTGEDLLLESDTRSSLKFRGWVKEASLKKLLNTRRIDIKELYRQSLKTRFKPIELGFSIKVKGKNSFREVLNHNVIAEIPGKSNKRIVITSHIDHFGIKENIKGDNILNGAIDSGTAVAAMMVTAKILKEFQKDLYYTITVLACNAEEAVLLGSQYYVNHTDKKNIITNINFESTPPWEKARSIMGIGARYSTIEDMLEILARKHNVGYTYFSMSEQGFFYRSDQFPFARQGIPSVWLSAGEDDESGQNKYLNYWKETYHTVKDEYDPTWDLGGMKQTIKFGLLLIDHINRTREVPRWKGKLTFPTNQ